MHLGALRSWSVARKLCWACRKTLGFTRARRREDCVATEIWLGRDALRTIHSNAIFSRQQYKRDSVKVKPGDRILSRREAKLAPERMQESGERHAESLTTNAERLFCSSGMLSATLPEDNTGEEWDWQPSRLTWDEPQTDFWWWDESMHRTKLNLRAKRLTLGMIEIRDARIPVTGVHDLVDCWARDSATRRIVVYTHVDLVTRAQARDIFLWTAQHVTDAESIFFYDTSDQKQTECDKLSELEGRIVELHDANIPLEQYSIASNFLVCGVPNVGKSSVIYILCKDMYRVAKKKGMYHAPKVSDVAGYTQGIKKHWMLQKPYGKRNIMLCDTPGLFPLRSQILSDRETIYKLVLTNLVQPKLVTPSLRTKAIEYMLFKLNQQRNFQYVAVLGLREPQEYASKIISDRWNASKIFYALNRGHFGPIMFDDLTRPPPAPRSQPGH